MTSLGSVPPIQASCNRWEVSCAQSKISAQSAMMNLHFASSPIANIEKIRVKKIRKATYVLFGERALSLKMFFLIGCFGTSFLSKWTRFAHWCGIIIILRRLPLVTRKIRCQMSLQTKGSLGSHVRQALMLKAPCYWAACLMMATFVWWWWSLVNGAGLVGG